MQVPAKKATVHPDPITQRYQRLHLALATCLQATAQALYLDTRQLAAFPCSLFFNDVKPLSHCWWVCPLERTQEWQFALTLTIKTAQDTS